MRYDSVEQKEILNVGVIVETSLRYYFTNATYNEASTIILGSVRDFDLRNYLIDLCDLDELFQKIKFKRIVFFDDKNFAYISFHYETAKRDVRIELRKQTGGHVFFHVVENDKIKYAYFFNHEARKNTILSLIHELNLF